MAKMKFKPTNTRALPTSVAVANSGEADWTLNRRLKQSDAARLSEAVINVEKHNDTIGKKVNSTNVIRAAIYAISTDDALAKKIMKVIKSQL